MQTLATEVFAQTGLDAGRSISAKASVPSSWWRCCRRTRPSRCWCWARRASGASNPGPLVTFLLSHLGRRVRIPVTLVPGELTVEEIDALS